MNLSPHTQSEPHLCSYQVTHLFISCCVTQAYSTHTLNQSSSIVSHPLLHDCNFLSLYAALIVQLTPTGRLLTGWENWLELMRMFIDVLSRWRLPRTADWCQTRGDSWPICNIVILFDIKTPSLWIDSPHSSVSSVWTKTRTDRDQFWCKQCWKIQDFSVWVSLSLSL